MFQIDGEIWQPGQMGQIAAGRCSDPQMSQILVKKDDSGYGGDDLSVIDDLDSLDDPLPASSIQPDMEPR